MVMFRHKAGPSSLYVSPPVAIAWTAAAAVCRTLLVYSRKDNRFSHYDSSPGSSNLLVAQQIAVALQQYLE